MGKSAAPVFTDLKLFYDDETWTRVKGHLYVPPMGEIEILRQSVVTERKIGDTPASSLPGSSPATELSQFIEL